MNTDELKQAIRKELEGCEDKDILQEMLLKLYASSENKLKETAASYSKNIDSQVPESHYNLLQRDWESYKRGEINATDWDDFEKELLKDLES